MGRYKNSNIFHGTIGNTQLTIENFNYSNILETLFYSGDISYMNKKDIFSINISKRKDIDPNGIFDIVAHGANKEIQINHNNKNYSINWRVLATILKHNKKYKSQGIRLLSCNTGKGENSFAQNLANKFNTVVYAPNNYLWSNSSGEYFVSGGDYIEGKLVPNNVKGDFIKFTPRRKK